jgi:kynurenine formamidase
MSDTLLDNELAFRAKVAGLRQWGRWGQDDERGAVNLVTPAKICEATALVSLGESHSLSRPFPVTPAENNPHPAQHYLRARRRGDHGEGSVVDYIGVACHGKATTHIDALCHVWNHDGMWNGRDAAETVDSDGVRHGGIESWSSGIITRGVLLDVAADRPGGYIDYDSPVTGDELAARADAIGGVRPGDALVIHSGREAWDRTHDRPWGSALADGSHKLPGLHSSCLDFFKESDCCMVVWDMMDAVPNEFGVPHCTHASIFSLGIALLDNALIEPLAHRCRELDRHDFMICVAPLVIVGGTGSPVNPLAVL